MDNILSLSVAEMAGLSFECSCGRNHSVGIKRILVGKGAADKTAEIAGDFKEGKVFLIADNNTYDACGKKVERSLQDNKFNLQTYIFNTTHPLVPDEKAVGRLLIEMDKNTSLIISVGSGTLNDIARILSFKLNIPYMIVGTAPSMDGYASTVSPLIVEGRKITYEAVYPYAIIADVDVMKEAPATMLHAGFGDIIGKFTALADWDLARRLNGEYYCETSVKMVKNALQKCIDNVDGILKRDEDAVKFIIEALILSGMAMGLVGNSRPASGAEHHMAHFWEVDALSKGKDHPLHGNSVGVGTVVITSIYELMKEELPAGMDVPTPSYIGKLLESIGAYSTPASLGIPKEVFRESVIHAMEIRPRYTIYHLAKQKNILEKFADELTGRFYE